MHNEPTATAGDTSDGDAGPTTYLAAQGPTAGMRIDRYLVLERIGAGGMGVVYAAYDPELDRRVAIKLVRDDEQLNAQVRRERLLREARAMARLDHAHVIRVFDAGTTSIDGIEQVFVAMELVDGIGLGKWAADRPARDVLGALVAAGRGLAAAHGAGLVHRDFKPDNVLVDKQDRVRVGDFGLAAAIGDDATVDDGAPATSGKLTSTGSVMGTPAFMAPEQHRGDAVDARADQFAFCVTTWLLVFARHPFAAETRPSAHGTNDDRTRGTGESRHELRRAVLDGRIAVAPSGPSWLEPLLRKGLAVSPEDRHRTLDELLDGIERRLRPRRIRVAVAGGAAVIAAGLLVARMTAAGDGYTCPAAEAQLRDVWGPAQHEALSARGRGGVATAAAFDRVAQSWAQAHDETCAARSQGDLSSIVIEQRERCLELRLAQIAALAPRLTAASDVALGNGSAIVEALPSPASCLQPRIVVDEPLPDDAMLRIMVQRQRTELGIASAFVQGGMFGEADDSLALLSDVAYPPLAAEMAEVRADLASSRGDDAKAIALYSEAIATATAAGHDPIAISTILDRAFMLEDVAEAARWYALAEGMIAKLGDPPGLRAHLHGNRAALHVKRGDNAAALVDARRAYQLRREHDGPGHALTANAAHTLAGALANAGKLADARDVSLAALVDAERVVTADHTIVRNLLRHLVDLHLALGDRAAARVAHERLLASTLRVYGADHAEVAELEVRRGVMLGAEGKHDQAVAAIQPAIAKLVRAHGEHAREVAQARGILSNQLEQAGRGAEAEAEILRAVVAFEKSLGDGHPMLARVYTGTGYLLYRHRKLADAETWLRRALALSAKLPDPGPSVANTHSSLALVLAAGGNHTEARRHAERAIELARSAQGMTEVHAEGELALALALRGQGDRAAAIAAAKRSLALYTQLGDRAAAQRAEVEALLAQR